MADPLPSSSDAGAAIARQVNRLWTLTVLSLTLNGVILVLILVGALLHHHQLCKRHDFGRQMAMMRMMKMGQRFGGMDRDWGRMGAFQGGPGGFGGRMQGQMPGGPGPMGGPPNNPSLPPNEAILTMLTQKLSLNDDQKAKVKAIVDDHFAAVQKQMEAQRAAVRAQVEDAKAKIKPLLTPEQQKEFDALPLPGE